MVVNKDECVLHAINGSSRLVWFDDKDQILFFIDKPFNEVRWEYGVITSQKEALTALSELKRTNWKIVTDHLELMIPKLNQ